ncbi:MAG: ABC transporter ATP-binding protein [Flavobacteriales bacterium]|jgi:iron complex transport system ATP-binding protein|nr:ABC transporter ATP-binding protein [Flavobacteriales bacterium]MCB9364001.1 ABC transporter ATP-binding protein [Flavobacteriales bacterium]
MDNGIHISNLSIGYQNKAFIEHINMDSNLGQFISIIGRNGEGKSTLIKTLTSLIEPISGNVSIANQTLFTLSEIEKSKLISVVLTNKIAIHNINVFDFVAYGRYPYTNWLGIKTNTDNSIISDAITLCNINHLSNKLYTELSDGERQKVNIARAIAQNTSIIVLDEPTAHLDLVNKIEVFKLLKLLVDKHEKTIIISTHQIELALQLSDEIWLINQQKIINATPSDIIKSGEIEKLFANTDVVFNAATNSFTVK